MEAQPPEDFDAPYSKLPPNVDLARVKKNVIESLEANNEKAHVQWVSIFEMEHADAVISDAFWYVICRVFLKKQENEGH